MGMAALLFAGRFLSLSLSAVLCWLQLCSCERHGVSGALGGWRVLSAQSCILVAFGQKGELAETTQPRAFGQVRQQQRGSWGDPKAASAPWPLGDFFP